MSELTIVRGESPDRLTIAWDNRRVAKQGCLTIALPVFWFVWTAATLFGTWLAIVDSNREWPGLILVGLAYLGVIGIPLTWILRYTEERVEITPEEFRHFYVRFPWFSPIRWPLSQISHIEVGHHVNAVGEIDAVPTLKVYAGNKHGFIGYWVDDDLKHQIFCAIRDHLHSLNSTIECRDNLSEDSHKID